MDNQLPPLTFDVVAFELRGLGLTLTRRPGEYAVNYRGGGESTAQMAETLDQALALGLAMAAEALAASTRVKRFRRPLRMTAKAIRRRMIRAHNWRLRGRALRNQPTPGADDDE